MRLRHASKLAWASGCSRSLNLSIILDGGCDVVEGAVSKGLTSYRRKSFVYFAIVSVLCPADGGGAAGGGRRRDRASAGEAGRDGGGTNGAWRMRSVGEMGKHGVGFGGFGPGWQGQFAVLASARPLLGSRQLLVTAPRCNVVRDGSFQQSGAILWDEAASRGRLRPFYGTKPAPRGATRPLSGSRQLLATAPRWNVVRDGSAQQPGANLWDAPAPRNSPAPFYGTSQLLVTGLRPFYGTRQLLAAGCGHYQPSRQRPAPHFSARGSRDGAPSHISAPGGRETAPRPTLQRPGARDGSSWHIAAISWRHTTVAIQGCPFYRVSSLPGLLASLGACVRKPTC